MNFDITKKMQLEYALSVVTILEEKELITLQESLEIRELIRKLLND